MKSKLNESTVKNKQLNHQLTKAQPMFSTYAKEIGWHSNSLLYNRDNMHIRSNGLRKTIEKKWRSADKYLKLIKDIFHCYLAMIQKHWHVNTNSSIFCQNLRWKTMLYCQVPLKAQPRQQSPPQCQTVQQRAAHWVQQEPQVAAPSKTANHAKVSQSHAGRQIYINLRNGYFIHTSHYLEFATFL